MHFFTLSLSQGICETFMWGGEGSGGEGSGGEGRGGEEGEGRDDSHMCYSNWSLFLGLFLDKSLTKLGSHLSTK